MPFGRNRDRPKTKFHTLQGMTNPGRLLRDPCVVQPRPGTYKGIERSARTEATDPAIPATIDRPRMSIARAAGRMAMVLGGILAVTSGLALVALAVSFTGYRVERDLAYGDDPRQKLDLYIPDRAPANAPVILFFYGGSWDSGRKGIYWALGQAFASKGIVVAVADYRLYPQVRYPAFLDDGARAFAWVHAHVARYGGDPARIFVAGHSAGAYIAVMLAADPAYLKAAGADPAWIRGVIGIAGPYNFLPLHSRNLIAIFGGANRADTQPIAYIDGKRPPMLLAAGTDDTTVRPRNTTELAARLKSFGSPVELRMYPDTGHIGILLSLAPGLRWKTPLRNDIIRFVMAH
jgi:acetyl esterase/lipase